VIKINVTDEMRQAMDRIEDGPDVDDRIARAVLDIVERDLNQAVRETDFEGYAIDSRGCIEVEG
jgi:hypothetical protein